MLHHVLCQRPPTPALPSHIVEAIDKILIYQRHNRILIPANSIPLRTVIERKSKPSNAKKATIHVSLWRGDITTLTDITAVINAANSALLGCFQPGHKCIDNVLHSAAGPRLREEMNRIMKEQGHEEPVGRAKVTPAFNLPAKYIIHTVGPNIDRRSTTPSEEAKKQLASCYSACLDAAETLPLDVNGRLSIAFCCISTGLFAFPKAMAAKIAVRTVIQWCEVHPDTPITDIIFDVFTEEDLNFYSQELDDLEKTVANASATTVPKRLTNIVPPKGIESARQWIQEADYLIISAGAGLSASDGLDYTSSSLFAKHYPALLKHGLNRLYDTIGFSSWPSAAVKWGYFFTHANLILQWPKSTLYRSLLDLAERFGETRYFVRTSNADGLFAANGFPERRIATPQGQYRYLQCYAKCRPDAVFPFADYLEKTLPHIDPETCAITDESLIPHCEFCGTELTICVRGGSYFNGGPFEEQEDAWYDFLEEIESNTDDKSVVILELGVGINTPSVLRWPNENLTENSDGKVKLVRVGLGPSACAPFELVECGRVAVIDGDIGTAVGLLTA
ncbi:A1pp-domain-containing protein [Lojkania enalia]|uniref:A1pp-domain-containing protein n=1 Tax=Lojkania enalia TaxID=147567 RepID=A0A9P4K9L2_9PLEO|nr:A1pp-domain-containing protein [Didymosphaeria enalia]